MGKGLAGRVSAISETLQDKQSVYRISKGVEKAMNPEEIDEFIALASSEEPISDYDPPCPHCKRVGPGDIGRKRKQRFLALGASVLSALKTELDVFGREDEKGIPYITINQAGIASSGDVHLDIGWVRIYFSHSGAFAFNQRHGWPGDFQFNFRETPTRWNVGGWVKYEELRDLPKLAARVKAERLRQEEKRAQDTVAT
jgi:hypothetical protein